MSSTQSISSWSRKGLYKPQATVEAFSEHFWQVQPTLRQAQQVILHKTNR